ncbi:MAG: NUDIX domain-containing protein [Halanaerobiales bacterium]
MSSIRNSVKAVIIKDKKLLCTKNKGEEGVFYLLPGGGQEKFETKIDALKRECREEITADVVVKDILFVREYIGKNHGFLETDSDVHQIEYMFECDLLDDTEIKTGEVPDIDQIGVEWVDIRRISEYNIYPSVLKKLINEYEISQDKIYLGDVN